MLQEGLLIEWQMVIGFRDGDERGVHGPLVDTVGRGGARRSTGVDHLDKARVWVRIVCRAGHQVIEYEVADGFQQVHREPGLFPEFPPDRFTNGFMRFTPASRQDMTASVAVGHYQHGVVSEN